MIPLIAGDEAAIILCEDNSVWVFGKGHLGFSTSCDEIYSPIPIMISPAFFNHGDIIRVRAGIGCFGVVTASGDLYTWGKNGLNIGVGENRVQPFPFRVPIVTKVFDVSFGFDHMIVQHVHSYQCV